MKFHIFEIIVLVLLFCALVLNIASLAVPHWMEYDEVNPLGRQRLGTRTLGLFETCWKYGNARQCALYANRGNYVGGPYEPFMRATTAMVLLALIFNVLALLVTIMFMFTYRFKLQIIKIVILILTALAMLCAMIGFAVWIGKWREMGREGFGPGVWLCVVTFILDLLALIVAILLKVGVFVEDKASGRATWTAK